MDENEPLKRKPLFSGIALVTLLVSLVLARSAATKIDAGESFSGYSSLTLTISFLVALLLSGLVTGQIGLIRGERPLPLPIAALLLNGVVFIAVILHIPR